MVPAVAHIVFIPHVYLTGNLRPIFGFPFFALENIAKGPVPFVLGIGPEAEIVFVAIAMGHGLEDEYRGRDITIAELHLDIESMQVAASPAEGDLEDLMELGECEGGRHGEQASYHWIIGQSHCDGKEVIALVVCLEGVALGRSNGSLLLSGIFIGGGMCRGLIRCGFGCVGTFRAERVGARRGCT